MAVNLIDLFSSSVGRDLAAKAASALGESPEATTKAVQAGFPALLGGLLNKSRSSGGANDVFRMLTGSGVDASLLDNLGAAFGGGSQTDSLIEQGTELLGGMFGEKSGGLGDALSKVAGIGGPNAMKLIAMMSPAVLAFLKRYIVQNKLDAAGVGRLLDGQKDFLRTGLDSRLTDAVGFGDVTSFLDKAGDATEAAARGVARGADRAAAGAASTARAAQQKSSGIGKWLGLAAAIFLGVFLYRTLTKSDVEDAVDSTVRAAESAAGKLADIELPGGASISALAGGPVASMVEHMKSGTGAKRFTLDGIDFTDSKIDLSEATTKSLDSIAAVLKAFPDAVITIEGSETRAKAIESAIEERGIPADRVRTQGAGATGPIAIVVDAR
ncbi:MAG: DUF937 domain-containing protein [Planctomycetota bacterium]